MSLSIYNIQHNQSPKIIQSFFGLNQIVRLAVYKNHFYTDENNKNILEGLPDIYCLLNTDQLSYGFSHSWSEGPGGKLFEKINDYMDQGMVKLISGVLGDGKYKTISPSDAWSQKILTETTPITISLKSKCFHPEYNKNTKINGDTELVNYKDFINFLILITAPQQVTVGNYVENFKDMLGKINGKNKTESEKEESNKSNVGTNVQSNNSFTNRILTSLGELLNDGAPTLGISDSGDNLRNHTRGNFSLLLKTEKMNGPQTDKIDWIVKNWSFKPSVQNIISDNIPEPLWIDFNIELETNMALSNMQVYNLFFTP